MYFSAAVAMIFTQLAGYTAALIDGIITSRMLGSSAYSAIALLNPFNGVILLLSGSISTGGQVMCSQFVGMGDRGKADSSFAVSLIIDMIFAGLLVIFGVFFPEKLFNICGITANSHPDIYVYMTEYLAGFIWGVPFMMLIQVLGPIIVMDSGKSLFTFSAFALAVSDIIGDLVNVFVFHGGNFGMGLATSLAYVLQFAILITHFLKKTRGFSFSLSAFQPSQLAGIFKAASPQFLMKFATALRDLFINRINLVVALTTAAVAARGMQNDLNTVLFCIGLGTGKALITMTGVYYGAGDRRGMVRLFSYSMKVSAAISGVVAVIVFVFAPYIAGTFSTEPEVIEFSVFSIRCMAIALVPDTLVTAFQFYLQGINKRGLINIISMGDRFVFPVLAAWGLGMSFGSKGIMASIAAGIILVCLFVLVIVCVHLKRFPTKCEDFMFLPDDFGGTESDNIYASISTMDDVSQESLRAEEFCLSHDVSVRKAKLMSLFVEEMAGNIIEHGKSKRRNNAVVDYRLSFNGATICLTLRDCFERFDTVAFYEAHSGFDMPGLSIVMKLAKDIRYFNSFNSNCIIITLDTKGDDEGEDIH